MPLSMLDILDWLNNGFWAPSVWEGVAYLLVTTHLTIVTVTLYLHRHLAHRALDLHPALAHCFRFWCWLSTGMIGRQWAAIHRKHHATTETEEDPHSPRMQGLGNILWRGTEAYRAAAADEALIERYGAGCPDDWVERNLYSRFPTTGVIVLALIDIALLGVIGLTVWAVQMLWIPVLGAGVINGVGHAWGYRNFESPDASANIVPWGFLIGGEELHNNHHAYPNSAKFSHKKWEFDLGWQWIRLFRAFGLAQAKSVGPIVERIPGKTTLDMDTAWAVLNDRFRLMAKYKNDVVKPLVRQECAKVDETTSRLFRKARSLLCRERILVCAKGERRIAAAVQASHTIATVYRLRVRLHDIWAKRGGNAEDLLAALRHWCRDAEATGIHALRDFVGELKSCALPSLARA